jgi:predicted transcriptional regulator
MANPPNIGRGELEILRYISDHHPLSVRELTAQMAEVKGLARTTILTVVERLRKKGYLTRKHIDGVYRYSPRMPKANVLKKLVSDFVETALGGSLAPFVSYLVEEAKVSEEDLKELKKVVRELEAQEKLRKR